jgi:hypothetical protein
MQSKSVFTIVVTFSVVYVHHWEPCASKDLDPHRREGSSPGRR